MKWSTTTGVAAVVGLAAVAGFFYLSRTPPAPPSVPDAVVAQAPAAAAPAEPTILYPVPPPADAALTALPPLDGSDNALRDALVGYFGKQSVQQLFGLDSIVRRIVVTVDNLPREAVSTRLLPTKPVSGAFLVSKRPDGAAIAPANSARYLPYVELARRTDAAQLASIYASFYPLFQTAYVELGYPKGYFNDRMVAVIDHLLAAPTPEGPVRLTQPHVLYKFADPQLESASAGHKIMLRMGSQNALVVKAKLREIRAELTRGATPPRQ
ncbi:MAG: DUF3014 domain-containing protein [Noviherbaspirillum sp.]